MTFANILDFLWLDTSVFSGMILVFFCYFWIITRKILDELDEGLSIKPIYPNNNALQTYI